MPGAKTAYRRGRHFEYRVRDLLRERGWWVVRQARSAFPDLVAIRAENGATRVLLVECRADGRISLDEALHGVSLATRIGAEFVVAVRRGRDVVLRHPVLMMPGGALGWEKVRV